MKIYIDCSVFVDGEGAFGNVSGYLEFVAVPPPGSAIAFTSPNVPAQFPPYSGFLGIFRVVETVFKPAPVQDGIALSLEDFVAPSLEKAKAAMRYFEEGFGLVASEYELGILPNPLHM